VTSSIVNNSCIQNLPNMESYILFFLVSFVQFVVPRGQKNPGIEFLGSGYDIIQGNPRNPYVGGDPGWKMRPIFQLNYREDKTTTDQHMWKIPDGTNVFGLSTCNTDYSSTQITGSTSYQSELDTSVTHKNKWIGLFYRQRYTVSQQWKNTIKATTDYASIVTQTVAECSVYYANFEASRLPVFTQDFVNSLDALPATYDADAYWQFLTIFGTNVIMELTLGGYRGEIYNMSREAYSDMTKNEYDVNECSKFSIFGYKGTNDVRTDTQIKMGDAFDQASTHQFSYNVGGTYDSDMKRWMQNSQQNPLPIAIVLANITEVMFDNYTGHYNISNLDKKRTNMEMALETYCDYWAQGPPEVQCQDPADYPDAPLPEPDRLNGKKFMIVNYYQPNCRIRRGSDGNTWRWCAEYGDEDFWTFRLADQDRYPDFVYTVENYKFQGEYLVYTQDLTRTDLIAVQEPAPELGIPQNEDVNMLWVYGSYWRLAFFNAGGINCNNERSAPECYGIYDQEYERDQVWILKEHTL